MATHLGKRHMQGLVGFTLTFFQPNGTQISGTAALASIQSLKLGHKADNKKVKNLAGNDGSILGLNEYLEAQFEFVPTGANDTEARANAGMPQNLATATVSGAPVIIAGPFTDALNTDTRRWIYEADANVDCKIDDVWGGTITLRRYPDITATQAS